ncbi:MAG: hypothetical protein WBF93_21445 [Pirellulales bacterium]
MRAIVQAPWTILVISKLVLSLALALAGTLALAGAFALTGALTLAPLWTIRRLSVSALLLPPLASSGVAFVFIQATVTVFVEVSQQPLFLFWSQFTWLSAMSLLAARLTCLFAFLFIQLAIAVLIETLNHSFAHSLPVRLMGLLAFLFIQFAVAVLIELFQKPLVSGLMSFLAFFLAQTAIAIRIKLRDHLGTQRKTSASTALVAARASTSLSGSL